MVSKKTCNNCGADGKPCEHLTTDNGLYCIKFGNVVGHLDREECDDHRLRRENEELRIALAAANAAIHNLTVEKQND